MLEKQIETTDNSILADDTQHINVQMIEAETKRFTALRFVLVRRTSFHLNPYSLGYPTRLDCGLNSSRHLSIPTQPQRFANLCRRRFVA